MIPAQLLSSYGLRYDLGNEVHYLSYAELDAVEISGRSNWMDYAEAPAQWPEPSAAVIPLMDARPGKTEPGSSPVPSPHPMYRSLITTEQAFVRRYLKYSNNSTLARIMNVWPLVVATYAKEFGVHRGRETYRKSEKELRACWKEFRVTENTTEP